MPDQEESTQGSAAAPEAYAEHKRQIQKLRALASGQDETIRHQFEKIMAQAETIKVLTETNRHQSETISTLRELIPESQPPVKVPQHSKHIGALRIISVLLLIIGATVLLSMGLEHARPDFGILAVCFFCAAGLTLAAGK